jgi:hypothetical protein
LHFLKKEKRATKKALSPTFFYLSRTIFVSIQEFIAEKQGGWEEPAE